MRGVVKATNRSESIQFCRRSLGSVGIRSQHVVRLIRLCIQGRELMVFLITQYQYLCLWHDHMANMEVWEASTRTGFHPERHQQF